ncbi:MAG: M48 family metallopeptidase [Alkalilacustris sp.]
MLSSGPVSSPPRSDPACALLSGDPPLMLRLRADPRARRFSLRVAHGDGRITLTFPPHAGREAALAFAREREAWLRTTLAGLPRAVVVTPGIRLPVLGNPLELVGTSHRTVRQDGERLLVPTGLNCGPAVAGYLRSLARTHLQASCRTHAALIQRDPTAIVLRDTRSRWGSCTAAGRLMFSWRLALAPVPVLDYVAAHEMAHLREMNHGPEFWRLVGRLCPGWRTHRLWLRRHGATLHRWRFDY